MRSLFFKIFIIFWIAQSLVFVISTALILSRRFPLGRSSSPKRISATLMAVTKKWPFSGFRDNHAITAGDGEGRIGSKTTLVSRIVITNVT